MIDKFLRRLYLTCLFIALVGILYRLELNHFEVATTIGTAGLFLASFVLMYEHEKKLDKRKNSDVNFSVGVDCGFDSPSASIIAEVDSDGHIEIIQEHYWTELANRSNRRK